MQRNSLLCKDLHAPTCRNGIEKKLLPVENELLPIENELLLTEQKLLPVEQKLLRIEQKLLRIEQKLLRIENELLPTEKNLLPVEQSVLEVAALALMIMDGLKNAVDDFPTPPVSVEELQTRLDAYNAAKQAAVRAKTDARAHYAVKDDAFEELTDSMRANLRYAEIAVRHQPEKLRAGACFGRIILHAPGHPAYRGSATGATTGRPPGARPV